MAKTKKTARKSTGPHGVPHHQLAPRNHELGEGSSKNLGEEGSSSNPANVENLNKELNTLRRAHAKDQEELAEMQRGTCETSPYCSTKIKRSPTICQIQQMCILVEGSTISGSCAIC